MSKIIRISDCSLCYHSIHEQNNSEDYNMQCPNTGYYLIPGVSVNWHKATFLNRCTLPQEKENIGKNEDN
jgi:hypothetical protein